MRGWLALSQGEYPALYTVLAARRAEVKADGVIPNSL